MWPFWSQGRFKTWGISISNKVQFFCRWFFVGGFLFLSVVAPPTSSIIKFSQLPITQNQVFYTSEWSAWCRLSIYVVFNEKHRWFYFVGGTKLGLLARTKSLIRAFYLLGTLNWSSTVFYWQYLLLKIASYLHCVELVLRGMQILAEAPSSQMELHIPAEAPLVR
jgi:hypothetical protein